MPGRGNDSPFASAAEVLRAGFDPDRAPKFFRAGPANEGRLSVQGRSVGFRRAGQDGSPVLGSPFGGGGSSAAPIAAAPVTAALAPAASAAPAAAPAAPSPSPIAAAIVGAINRSSGDTGSAALNTAAVERARRAGTSREDLVTSVDNSRQRSQSQGIVGGRPLGGLANIGASARIEG